MNIHLPAILMFTRGTRFWPIPIFQCLQCSWSWRQAKWSRLLICFEMLSEIVCEIRNVQLYSRDFLWHMFSLQISAEIDDMPEPDIALLAFPKMARSFKIQVHVWSAWEAMDVSWSFWIHQRAVLRSACSSVSDTQPMVLASIGKSLSRCCHP